MNDYGFIKAGKAFLYLGFLYIAGLFVIVSLTIKLIMLEVDFHKKYGKDWVQEYEKYNGPISHTNAQIALGPLSLIAIGLVLWWFYRQTHPKKPNKKESIVRKGRR